MEDSDWTDLPSVSCVDSTVDHEDIFFGSSMQVNCLLEKGNVQALDKDNGQLHVEQDTADNKNEVKKGSNKEPLNPKQEKDSCPICLSSFEDRSFLDQCFHSFCFCCILQWCEVVQTCPLCKSEFGSVIHSVKSMQDYEQHIIEKKSDTAKAPSQTHIEVSYDQHGFDERGNRFRYRTTRQVHERENNTSHQWHSEDRATTSNSEGWGDEARSRRRSRHRQKQRNERIEGIEKRRQVYGFKLRAISTLGSGKQRRRNTTSKFYKSNPACTHRLIPWLLRDLRVLLGNSDEEINFLMEFILSLIARIDMDSEQFLEELRPFLLDTTEHFVHELLSFAKAPFDLNAYDECVVYPWPEDGNNVENSQNTASIVEKRTDRPVHVGRTPLGNRTSLSRCEWSDTPDVLHQGHEEVETHCRVQNNEILEPSGAAHLNTAERSETNYLNARTSDTTRVSEEDSRIATRKKSSSEQSGRCDSVIERIASMPSSSIDNVASKSGVVTKDSLQDWDSTRHKGHKHDRHKHKHEQNGRKSFVHGQSDSVNERIVSMPGSSVDNVPSESEVISTDSLQDYMDSSRHKRRKHGKHKHKQNGRNSFIHVQSDSVNERIASMPCSSSIDNVPSESEIISRNSLQDWGSTRHKRHKHDRHKHKHKHKRKHTRKHERKSEHDKNIDPISGSVSCPISAPCSTSGCISDSSAVYTPRSNVHVQEPLKYCETKSPSTKRSESPTIECMFKEINELDARIRQHEELLSLAEMETP